MVFKFNWIFNFLKKFAWFTNLNNTEEYNEMSQSNFYAYHSPTPSNFFFSFEGIFPMFVRIQTKINLYFYFPPSKNILIAISNIQFIWDVRQIFKI